MLSYIDFLRSKMCIAHETGIDIQPEEISPILKPHQRDAVIWALHGGCRAVFASFGMGKTLIQLEFSRIVIKHKGGKALIIVPLGVKQEFVHDAVFLLGMDPPEYVRNMTEVEAAKGNILLTNYERVRDGDIDPTCFTVCCLDEAAVLRSFGSKTYQTFLPKFNGVGFKLVCTATPDPNKYKELIHYAGFLEIMDTGQALTRFFQRDSTKANNLTLYPHKEEEFWLWVSSWALFITKPSDVNPDYSDEGYDLPPLQVNYHKLTASDNLDNFDENGEMKLFRDASLSLQDASREKKDSISARVSKAAEIVNASPDEHFILWHDREEERSTIKKTMPEAVEIYGSLDLDIREQRTIDFAEGKYRLLATKKCISGSGCNFQRHCHRAIFVGIDYEFSDFIQAIHRIYRFLQTKQVIIDIIYMDTESEILKVLLEKWERFKYQTEKMAELVRKNGLNGEIIAQKMQRSIGVERVKITGEHFTAVNNDCILECETMESNSIDLIHTSIPFSNHYEYTPSYNDFGHNEDTARFFEQMDYLSPNLLRILKPGRVYACHVKDRVLFGNATGTGMPTMEPFHALCIQHYMRHGFQYFGMITVVTDVVRENNQTYRLGWTEQCKDGSKMGVGCPEYILLFRKLPTDTSTAYADTPVTKSKEQYTRAQWQIDAHAFWRSSGNRLLDKDEVAYFQQFESGKIQGYYTKHSRNTVYDYEKHVELARALDEQGKLPATYMVVAPGSWDDTVWDDILRFKTLNAEQKRKDLQMHVCPLQLDIVDRIINRYSNPDEVVFDPFGGIGTVAKEAIRLGRKGYFIELNCDYFRDGVGYCKSEEEKIEQPTLFDFMDEESEDMKNAI